MAFDEQTARSAELDESTGYYYYGARYYDPGMSIFLSVDPLAEQFPNWNPYHYVHNNPINLVDPTGMSGEDWVHYKGENGKNQFIFDGDVTTVEQATKKGYKNVQSVSSQIELKSGTESYKLSENATVTDMNANKTVNTGFNLADGSYIGENNMLKSSAEGLQKGGEKMFYGGITATASGNPYLAALGAVSASIGGAMSAAGSFLDIVNDAIHDKFSVEKTITKGVLFFVGNKLGKVGSSQLENMMNEGLIDALDKTLDHARDKEIGPYKKQL
ncbi:MAG: hypothetical protein LBI72_02185 [Flavobacteriaceae bacterium]|nr:hypothetical protein [Flavobacteriaceae bacterium]